MNRLLRIILVITLLIACFGCFIPGRGWVVPGDEVHGDHDRGGHGDHDRGRHNGHEERH